MRYLLARKYFNGLDVNVQYNLARTERIDVRLSKYEMEANVVYSAYPVRLKLCTKDGIVVRELDFLAVLRPQLAKVVVYGINADAMYSVDVRSALEWCAERVVDVGRGLEKVVVVRECMQNMVASALEGWEILIFDVISQLGLDHVFICVSQDGFLERDRQMQRSWKFSRVRDARQIRRARLTTDVEGMDLERMVCSGPPCIISGILVDGGIIFNEETNDYLDVPVLRCQFDG